VINEHVYSHEGAQNVNVSTRSHLTIQISDHTMPRSWSARCSSSAL